MTKANPHEANKCAALGAELPQAFVLCKKISERANGESHQRKQVLVGKHRHRMCTAYDGHDWAKTQLGSPSPEDYTNVLLQGGPMINQTDLSSRQCQC